MTARPPEDGRPPQALESREARVRALVEDHFDFIWRLLRRRGLAPPDADDAAQRVFMIATQKLSEIAFGSERSFLYGIALRTAANARRTVVRRREVADQDLRSHHADTARPDEATQLRRAWELLDELFAALPEELARVLALAEIEQMAVPEIAELERIPVGTAASRLRRARISFRQLLEKLGPRNPFSPEGP
jgi:RNA polymerase sigma-70 factor, ECF subfamily